MGMVILKDAHTLYKIQSVGTQKQVEAYLKQTFT